MSYCDSIAQLPDDHNVMLLQPLTQTRRQLNLMLSDRKLGTRYDQLTDRRQ